MKIEADKKIEKQTSLKQNQFKIKLILSQGSSPNKQQI